MQVSNSNFALYISTSSTEYAVNLLPWKHMARTQQMNFSPPAVPWPRVQVSPVAEALAETQPSTSSVVDHASRLAATVFFLLSLSLLVVCIWLLWRVWGLAQEVRELRALESQRRFNTAVQSSVILEQPQSLVSEATSSAVQITQPSPTVSAIRQLPDDWERYAFPDIAISVYAPPGYRSDLRLQDTGEYFARFWQGDNPETAKIMLRVLRNWDSVADLKDKPRNLRIDRGIYAAKIEPPARNSTQLDQYKTEYVFEYNRRIYVFSCIHNWEQQSIVRCNTMMNSLELGR